MLLKTVTVENFRGIEKIVVDLDTTTVLIGENNSGKSSFIDAVRLALDRAVGRRGNPFEDYDHHLADGTAQPGDCGKLAVTLVFAETKPGDWPAEVVQALGDAIVFDADGCQAIVLRVTCHLEKALGDFVTDFEFRDLSGARLAAKAQQPRLLYELLRTCPIHYLSAQRDAAREFQPRSQMWGRYLRNLSMPEELRRELEDELSALNDRILAGEPRLERLRQTLAKAQEVVELASTDTVRIEAVPARIWDIMARAQVAVGGSSGASLPLLRHGSGTQSLSVILLFEAFLTALQEGSTGKHTTPILAVEEPEAHLHPSAVRSLWGTLKGFSGQKIIATHSGDLLAAAPLRSIRRFHRSGGKIEVRNVRHGTLGAEDMRKLHLHVQKTRGELLFARCWLLGEGPTEYWVFTETARLMRTDFDRLGIAYVPYRQVEAAPFVKLADDLGIRWFCVGDGDDAGQKTRKSLLPLLGSRKESDHLILLPCSKIELYLCQNGLGSVYERQMARQKLSGLTAKPGDADYWPQVLSCLPNKLSKEQVAIDAMTELHRAGAAAIPPVLRDVVNRAAHLATS
jgi:putative ATP-dependent endonuclease of OLD family